MIRLTVEETNLLSMDYYTCLFGLVLYISCLVG